MSKEQIIVGELRILLAGLKQYITDYVLINNTDMSKYLTRIEEMEKLLDHPTLPNLYALQDKINEMKEQMVTDTTGYGS